MRASELVIKSLAGMLFLMICMGAAIFLPFGSLAYPLAWVYLIIFFTGALLITVYLFVFDKHLLQSRLAAGPLAEPTASQKLIQAAASLAFIGIYLISALDHKYLWSTVPQPICFLSDALCLLAFVFLFFVFKQNTFLSAKIEVQDQQRVITTGLYAVVRHPMYTGALILMLFTPLALGSFWGLIPSLILVIIIGVRAVDEEHQLSAGLVGYKEYCSKVKYRLIPFIF
ncbi:MAG TPA: isoprenylcysteine carboxylmethyltransferase family protein [Puia sp.]|jgi:protein-S-isoprenylcysteine O-methyltransferase Ste14|nr:isoprenylcysteine carboxylmethyltransferase family protein [Puia sp.]